MPSIQVHLVRHGQSTWNVEGRLQGQTVHPRLTPLGWEQARAAAAEVAGRVGGEPVEVWSSDLVRAVETAGLVGAALRVPVHYDEALREQALGALEGRLTRELRAGPTPPGRHVSEVRWGGGESIAEVHLRIRWFLSRVLPHAAPPHIRHLVLVSHGDAIRVARAVLEGVGHRDVGWGDLPNGAVVSMRPSDSVSTDRWTTDPPPGG